MVPERYNIENLQQALRNPTKFVDEAKRITPNPLFSINNIIFNLKHDSPVDIMEEDWDNLLILDACRYDIYKDINYLDGELKPVVSHGSHSRAFMQGNFRSKELHDTVYVTANPHASKISNDVFYTVVNVLESWDDKIETVHPETVMEEALDAIHEYPNKRLIVHFMQPHQPPIGPMADKIRKKIDLKGYPTTDNTDNVRSGIKLWDAVKEGDVSQPEMLQAYQESLEIVLGYCNELNDEIDGKTIITADHGEMLGERILSVSGRKYGHPHGIDTRELKIVPWHIIESGSRRDIIREDPIGSEDLDQEVINDRLTALGYTPE